MKLKFLPVVILTTILCFMAPVSGCAEEEEQAPPVIMEPTNEPADPTDETDQSIETDDVLFENDDDFTIEIVGVLIVDAEKEEPEPEPYLDYTEADLDLFARIIYAEAGSSWLPDQVQLYVGSVILNRLESSRFPNTLYDVIYQPGQYEPTWSGAINNIPDQRTIDNARFLLENGSILPPDVVFQAGFKQGSGVYWQYYDSVLGSTEYFCFI